LILNAIVANKLILYRTIFRTLKKNSLKKSADMIEKVLDEIVLAKATRECVGTYSG
tara:strand:- start:1124 stop:1291 length:168 start_codon:yes stop_codon:yes gene_type:complete